MKMESKLSGGGRRVFAPVTEQSQIGEARRDAVELARQLGADEVTAAEVAIVVTELATNLVKHTKCGGAILVQIAKRGTEEILQILSLDRGQGIARTERAIEDGYSTAGTLGNGLGAVKRLAHFFDIYSEPDKGTVVVAEYALRNKRALQPASIAGVCVPKKGEVACGDTWGYVQSEAGTIIMVADGLGHGIEAADASRAAVLELMQPGAFDPEAILLRTHKALRSTRGAAVAVAVAPAGKERLYFCGAGNISACITRQSGRQALISQDGTLGFEVRRFKTYDYDFPAGSLLIMHSDGCSSRWNIDEHPRLVHQSPLVAAGVLFRDTAKGTDDMTIAVLRSMPTAAAEAARFVS